MLSSDYFVKINLAALKTSGNEYKYKTVEKKIIEPTDFSVTQPTEGAYLTLITCAPLFSTKQRLVVVGELLEK